MIITLLLTASVLGALAFFEPCTIATNTLFAARAHQTERGRCCRGLLLVWLTRSVLLGGWLAGWTLLTTAPQWSPLQISIGLLILGSLYLISRRVYLPVPHLTFYSLIPGNKAWPEAVRLGLTLPACVIPLLIVVTAFAVSVDHIAWAAGSGFLFASLFTLPLALAAHHGLNTNTRQQLGRLTQAAPYATAAMMFTAAVVIVLPEFTINMAQLREQLQHASLLGIGLSFLAGLVFSFNPVSFASIPVVLAYVTHAGGERRALLQGGAFVTGLILTHIVLGVAAALGGDWVKGVMGREWGLLLGPLLLLLGLMWTGWLSIRLPWFGLRGIRVKGTWGAFALGIPFSVAVCPFCAPAMLIVLTASAAIGSVGFGLLLLLAFALGRSIPILLGAWAMGWLESLRPLAGRQRGFEVTGGLLLMLSGIYLLNEYYLWVDTSAWLP